MWLLAWLEVVELRRAVLASNPQRAEGRSAALWDTMDSP